MQAESEHEEEEGVVGRLPEPDRVDVVQHLQLFLTYDSTESR